MSVSLQIRAAGFQSLLLTSGEDMISGGSTVRAVVNRSPLPTKDAIAAKDGDLDFDLMGLSTIECPLSVSRPSAGEFFADSLGCKHRVKFVKITDVSWIATCFVSQSLEQ